MYIRAENEIAQFDWRIQRFGGADGRVIVSLPCGLTPQHERFDACSRRRRQGGRWTVDCGLWTVDCGLWTVDCGLWQCWIPHYEVERRRQHLHIIRLFAHAKRKRRTSSSPSASP
jgi:hypothetical protein